MPKLLFTTSTFNLNNFIDKEKVESKGYELITNPYGKRLTEETVSELMDDDVFGMVAGVEPLTESVLNKAPNIKVISRCGIGIDNVDLTYAKDNNISIFNTPDAPSRSVAELTLAHIFSLARRLPETDRIIRKGEWQPLMGNLISKQTIGIIGYGRIGRLVANMLHPLAKRVIVYDVDDVEASEEIEKVSLDYIYQNSDIISLHVPYSSESHNIINADVFKKLKDNAILINVARGGLVDEDALYIALNENRIRGAAFDCFVDEPYEGKLLELDNIQFSAHMGSYAAESRSMMEQEACARLIVGLQEHGLL